MPYVKITRADFDQLLATFKRTPDWTDLSPRTEIAYEWYLPRRQVDGPRLVVRLLTSVDPRTGEGRDLNEDAIRVVVVRSPRGEDRILWAAKRVYRMQGWQERVSERLREIWILLRQSPSCPTCGDYMLLKSIGRSPRGRRFFWSCCRYQWTGRANSGNSCNATRIHRRKESEAR